ncbi:MAG: SMP-30/gluconolactonase/LRE family protein [Polaromonas sp.]|uniref:SMP-30/gluconolactonase/LRE family protein n=1 Tax=Polaromonas sp. TaxID=1869339 RepID=UPI0025DA4313|nr:SMP-30/gluconolactonase/LRE family protein [Polaromonas sp.]MBI2727453.1 SMP-30/gluconolactonase/LRE family protein [Polaromonas sp.]
MTRIEIVTEKRDELGECPLWDERTQSLFWIDSHARLVRRIMPASGEYREWLLPTAIGSIALCESGRLLVALASEFSYLDLTTGKLEKIAGVTHVEEKIRMNDGRTDRAGRFVAGSLVMGRNEKLGALYQVDATGKVQVLDKGFAISNGTCFSPDGNWLYFTDSRTRKIMRYPYDKATGKAGTPTVLIDTEPLASAGDGATVDSEGFIWTALVEIGKMGRFSPEGKLDRLIDMPVRHVTCPCFGGPNLDILYVTSISNSGNALKDDHPDAGALFAVHDTGVRGLPEVRIADRA